MRSSGTPQVPEGASHGIQPASKKGGRGGLIGRMNTKLHAVTDGEGRPLRIFMSAGQVSDYTGVQAMLRDLPPAKWFLGHRGYDADWLRESLQDKGLRVCIPGRKGRKTPVRYDRRRYKRRNRIEIMFGRLKDWVRSLSRTSGVHDLTVATRYDRCPQVFSQPSPSPQPSFSGYEA